MENIGLRTLLVVSSAASLALGVLEARRLLACTPQLTIENVLQRARHVLPATLLPLAVVVPLGIVNSHRSWQWALPIWIQYAAPALFWFTLVGVTSFLFGLGLTVALRTRHPKRWSLLTAAFCVEASLLMTQARVLQPAGPDLRERLGRNGEILQSTGSSCAPAAIANICRHVGIEADERSVARHLGTTTLGTNNGQVFYGLRSLGFDPRIVRVASRDVREVQPPALLVVDHPETGPDSHVIALLDIQRDVATVIDPLHGRLRFSVNALRQLWRGRAFECRIHNR